MSDLFLARLPAYLASLAAKGFVVDTDQRARLLGYFARLAAAGQLPDSRERLANVLSPLLATNPSEQDLCRETLVDILDDEGHDEPSPVPPSTGRDNQAAEIGRRGSVLAKAIVAFSGLLVAVLLTAGIGAYLFGGHGSAVEPSEPGNEPAKWLTLDQAAEQWFQSFPIEELEPPVQSPWNRTSRWYYTEYDALKWAAVLVPLGFWIGGTAYLFVLLGTYLRREALRRNLPSLPWRLAPPRARLGDRGLITELQRLRGIARGSVTSLDIEATVHASAAVGGLLQPQFRESPVPREFITLIDRRSQHDHVADIAHLVVRALLDANVALDVFEFHHEPALCRAVRSGEIVPLTQLVRVFPDSVFVIFANPDQLCDPVTGGLSMAATALSQPGEVILLTPAATEADGPAARRLEAKLGIRSYPMSAEGLRSLATHLVSAGPHGASRNGAVQPGHGPERALFAFLERRPGRWMQRATPPRQDRSRLLQLLRDALGERGFAWLAATSLFPELRWPLTVSLRSRLQSSNSAAVVDPALQTVARLPWFRAGWMPEWARKALIGSLGADYRNQVRRALVAAIDPSNGSLGGERISVHVGHARSLGSRNAVRADRILLDYMLPLLPSDRGWFEVPRGWVVSMVRRPLRRLLILSSLGFVVAAFLSASTLAVLPIDECDLYASSASDPLRVGPPIDHRVLYEIGSRAVDACQSSVERQPSNPRYQYQLYRALTSRRVISENDSRVAQDALNYAMSRDYPVAFLGQGVSYKDGKFGETDVDKAKQFYSLAAAKGVPEGLLNLALVYEDEGDQETSFHLYNKYESQGGIYLWGLAIMYRDGLFVEADRKKYREIILECARRRGPDCFDELGYLYEHGELGEIDYDRAIHAYERALQYAASPYAAYRLADLYFSGRGMDEPDLSRAAYYAVFAQRLNKFGWELDPVTLLCNIVASGEVVWPEGVPPPPFCPMQSTEGDDPSITD